jgi:hypothetical protein
VQLSRRPGGDSGAVGRRGTAETADTSRSTSVLRALRVVVIAIVGMLALTVAPAGALSPPIPEVAPADPTLTTDPTVTTDPTLTTDPTVTETTNAPIDVGDPVPETTVGASPGTTAPPASDPVSTPSFDVPGTDEVATALPPVMPQLASQGTGRGVPVASVQRPMELQLPSTGGRPAGEALIGLVLLVSGGLSIAVARRARTT